MDDRFELIDAFVDGERVDAAALKRLLAEDDGRNYFVDAWLLREGVLDDLARESVPPLRPRAGRRWPMLAIAASLACLMIGGLAGERLATPRGAMTTTPVVDVKGSTPAGTSFPAPPPTRAIPVEFSPDTGARGGN